MSRVLGSRRASRLVIAALLFQTTPALAAKLSGAAGFEYFRGLGGLESRAALGVGALDGGAYDALAQLVRYDDATGAGSSFTGTASAAIAGPLRARGRVTRSLGDQGFRSWLYRAGPELRLGTAASISAAYERFDAGDTVSTRGVAAEGLVSVARAVVARTTFGWARDRGIGRVVQATGGAIWRVATHLDLSADVGWAQVRHLESQAIPAGGPGAGLPLLGGGKPAGSSTSGASEEAATTLLLGARVVFP